MKWLFFLMVLLSATAFGRNDDLQQKIEALDDEIVKAEQLIKTESNPEIYETFLKELKSERKKYRQLIKVKEVKKKSFSDDPTITKTIPKAVQKKAETDNELTSEALPIQQRYDLLLREMANSRDVLIKLKASNSQSQSTKKFIAEEEERLSKLEKLKLDYEISLSGVEENEYSEFKKNGLRVGAMMDFYYQYDFNRASNAHSIQNRNYNNRANDFTLNLLELNVLKSYKNLDFYADLDFGQFAEQNSAHNNDPQTVHIGQAFLRYKLPDLDGVTVTAGKFYSHVGLEVAKSIDNRNYSRPYSFTRGIPFWHEGISVYKSGLGPFGVGLYVYDKTDSALENNTGKAYGSQISFIQDTVTSYFNFITAAETANEGNMRTIYEWNIVWAPKKTLNFAFDVTYGGEDEAAGDEKDTSWLGLVGYIDYNYYNRNYLCLRVENFKDLTNKNAPNNIFRTADAGVDPSTDLSGVGNNIDGSANIMSYTLTHRYNMRNGSEIRGEWRTDQSSEKIYPRNNGKFSENQNTLTVAWLYSI